MRRILLSLYSVWAAFWFLFIFLLIFPFQYLFLQKESWKPLAHRCNRIWAQLFFPLIGMPVFVRFEGEKPDEHRAYVFVSNHFSYLDIAVYMLIVKNYFAFMGKSVLKKAPLFGYMFAKLHIQVDRNDPQSRSKSLQRSYRALSQGRSMVIYPEGGIKATHPPAMFPNFKDGAFKMAVKQQVPIVPITLLNNYKRLPDKKKIGIYPGAIRAVIHQPIETKGLGEGAITRLKEDVFALMQTTLDEYHRDPKAHREAYERFTVF
ncbi:MAG: 1-acyl-sn-glycerol-3-phosphate acyltransferase [Siphonobacter aquaeclarae]|nr:1-acyl-sn-glycerol-3-phosphate acyltransferase [Siphonobacter aquaeclarae]